MSCDSACALHSFEGRGVDAILDQRCFWEVAYWPARLGRQQVTAFSVGVCRSKCARLPPLLPYSPQSPKTPVGREPLSTGPRYRWSQRRQGSDGGGAGPRHSPPRAACHGLGVLQRRPVRWGRDVGDRAGGRCGYSTGLGHALPRGREGSPRNLLSRDWVWCWLRRSGESWQPCCGPRS